MKRFLPILTVLLTSCATTGLRETISPNQALEDICEWGSRNEEVKGQVLMKMDSPQGSGSFPASVRATSTGTLDMEVSNPLGGLEAEIKVHGKTFNVHYTDQRYKNSSGKDYWNGIPLEWAPVLFLGQIPCPPISARKDSRIEWTQKDTLLVEALTSGGRSRERYTYRVTSWRGKTWANALSWETLGPLGTRVDFEFFTPDETTGQPLRWNARSVHGSVKTRWQSRYPRP